jgi:hypothetical protein
MVSSSFEQACACSRQHFKLATISANSAELKRLREAAVEDATVLDHQNRIFEMLAAALIGQGNNEAPVPCQPAPQANFRITDFSRLNPPKFSRSKDPIEADDWLREIEMKLDVGKLR